MTTSKPKVLITGASGLIGGLVIRKPGAALDALEQDRWRAYLAGYRSVRPIPETDLAAIAPFVAVRQVWLMGEYAGRMAVWGTQAMPTAWLRKQVDLLRAWEALATPAP